LHLGNEQKFDSSRQSRDKLKQYSRRLYTDLDVDKNRDSEIEAALRDPFSKKTRVYDMNGEWNGKKLMSSESDPSEWRKLDLGETYDIWAIPGTSPGEISVYTSTGHTIKEYSVKGDAKHIRDFDRLEKQTVGSVRAVRRKAKAPPGETDSNWNLAVYGLCYPACEIVVFAPPPKLKGTIWTPLSNMNMEKDFWRYPIGINGGQSARLGIRDVVDCVRHS
jgi:hypothetical protein